MSVVPSWDRRGGRAIKTLERRGRGGHSGLTTPSALSKVASQHFLDAQPPLLSQEGTTLIPKLKLRRNQASLGRYFVASEANDQERRADGG